MPKDKEFEGALDSVFDFLFSSKSKKGSPSKQKKEGMKLEGLANAGEFAETLVSMASAPAMYAGETVAATVESVVGGVPITIQFVGKPDTGKYANLNPMAGRVRVRLKELGSLRNVRSLVEGAQKKFEQEQAKTKLLSLFGAGQVADAVLSLAAAKRTGVDFDEAYNLGRANAYLQESPMGGADLRDKIIENHAETVAMALESSDSKSEAMQAKKKIMKALNSGSEARMARYVRGSGEELRLRREGAFRKALSRQGFSSTEVNNIVTGMLAFRSASSGIGEIEFSPGLYRDSVKKKEIKKIQVLQKELGRALGGDVTARDVEQIRKDISSSYKLQNLVEAMNALGGTHHNYSFSFGSASQSIKKMMSSISDDTDLGRRIKRQMQDHLTRVERARQKRVNAFGYNHDKFLDSRKTWREAVRSPYFQGGQYTKHWKEAQMAVIDSKIDAVRYQINSSDDPFEIELLQLELGSLVESKENVIRLTRPLRRTSGDLQTSYGLVKDFMQGNMFNLSQIIGGSVYYDVPKAPGTGNHKVTIMQEIDGNIRWGSLGPPKSKGKAYKEPEFGMTVMWNDTGSEFTDNINRLLVQYGYHWMSLEGNISALLTGSRALFRSEMFQRDLVKSMQDDIIGNEELMRLLKGYYRELFSSEGFAESERFLKVFKDKFGVSDPMKILKMLGDGTDDNPWNEKVWAKFLGSDYLGVMRILESEGITGLSSKYFNKYNKVKKLFLRGKKIGAPLRRFNHFINARFITPIQKLTYPIMGGILKVFGRKEWGTVVDQFLSGKIGINEMMQKGINMLLDWLGFVGTGGLATIARFFLSQALSTFLNKMIRELLMIVLYIMGGLFLLFLCLVFLLMTMKPTFWLSAWFARGDRYIDPLDNRAGETEGTKINALYEVEDWPEEWNAEYDCPININATCAQGAYGSTSHFHPEEDPNRELYAIDFTPTDWSHAFKAPTDLTLTYYDTSNTACGGIAQFTDTKGNIFVLYHVRLLPPYNIVAGSIDEEDPLLGTSQIPKGADIAWMQTKADFATKKTKCWDGTHFHLEIISPSGKRYNAEQWMYDQCGNLVNQCPGQSVSR